MSLSLNLYRLQQIDTQLDQTNQRLLTIQALLADTTLLDEVMARKTTSETALLAERKRLQQADRLVQEQKIKIEQTEAALYGGKVRNPKELQDLQLESASLKKHLSTLEDRMLEIMFSVDEQEAEVSALDSEYLNIQAHTEQGHAQLRGEVTSLEQLRERLILEHQAAENVISAADLQIYQQLRKTRNGVAVAKITDRTCGACGASLTPALVQAANAPTQFARCASCSRILYPG